MSDTLFLELLNLFTMMEEVDTINAENGTRAVEMREVDLWKQRLDRIIKRL